MAVKFFNKIQASPDQLIMGKDQTTNIVSIEVHGDTLTLFRETPEGIVTEERPNLYWLVNPDAPDCRFEKLEGDLYYKYIKTYTNRKVWMNDRRNFPMSWSIWDEKESAMVYNGYNYFLGMEPSDVSVLSFDIESAGFLVHKYKEVYMISNTYKKGDKIIKKLFSSDNYESEKEMLLAWCEWVREVDPSVITGHNIYAYDIPYLELCAIKCGITLDLGRDGSPLVINKRGTPSDFRVDGSQNWEYRKITIYGRELIDTQFLCVKWDFSRMLPSWGLKPIIEFLGLVKEGREFYDAGTIKDNWDNPVEREKIKRYGEHDSDDALALYEKMIPQFFLLANMVPKPFCDMILRASGGQINSMIVRAYCQKGHSLPRTSPKGPFKGGISDGYPGIYRNLFKIDIASEYPSIMIQYDVCDEEKDPLRIFPSMVKYFLDERSKNKKKFKDTGDLNFHYLEQTQKIVCNSFYGLLSTPGLLFNSPDLGSFVTEMGRECLKQAVHWATGEEFVEKDEK